MLVEVKFLDYNDPQKAIDLSRDIALLKKLHSEAPIPLPVDTHFFSRTLGRWITIWDAYIHAHEHFYTEPCVYEYDMVIIYTVKIHKDGEAIPAPGI